ncbi:hypothetical protein DAEQUDRAFT_192804 [Daedalea quercina L-15889]|uniref:Uncharacterized protein n=1 Tax=Daedalea quercina L-15889 TaxID=1314783 RepID=A0A165U5J2_9APHY|nr:hypothetical protein DAEQUDRAFT_192804 [Daedalea quercina L-15889]
MAVILYRNTSSTPRARGPRRVIRHRATCSPHLLGSRILIRAAARTSRKLLDCDWATSARRQGSSHRDGAHACLPRAPPPLWPRSVQSTRSRASCALGILWQRARRAFCPRRSERVWGASDGPGLAGPRVCVGPRVRDGPHAQLGESGRKVRLSVLHAPRGPCSPLSQRPCPFRPISLVRRPQAHHNSALGTSRIPVSSWRADGSPELNVSQCPRGRAVHFSAARSIARSRLRRCGDRPRNLRRASSPRGPRVCSRSDPGQYIWTYTTYAWVHRLWCFAISPTHSGAHQNTWLIVICSTAHSPQTATTPECQLTPPPRCAHRRSWLRHPCTSRAPRTADRGPQTTEQRGGMDVSCRGASAPVEHERAIPGGAGRGVSVLDSKFRCAR